LARIDAAAIGHVIARMATSARRRGSVANFSWVLAAARVLEFFELAVVADCHERRRVRTWPDSDGSARSP
jgi:hypothetical protein